MILALVFVRTPLGSNALGSQRWFNLKFIQVQPSEFAVLAMILAIATYCERRPDGLSMRDVTRMLMMASIPILLVFVQPDLGTAIIMVVVLVVMLAVAGVPGRFLVLLGIASAGIATLAIILGVLQHYQVVRLTSFLGHTPYQVVYAKAAIAGGGVWGEGFFHGVLTQGGYVPEQQTDFIFTAVGEQLGFVGALGLLVRPRVRGRPDAALLDAREGPPRAPARRRGVHVLRVQLLPERRDAHGAHARDGDPAPVHELRGLCCGVLLPGGRDRALRHEPTKRGDDLVTGPDPVAASATTPPEGGAPQVEPVAPASAEPDAPGAQSPEEASAEPLDAQEPAPSGDAEAEAEVEEAPPSPVFRLVEVLSVTFDLPSPSPIIHLQEEGAPHRVL